MYEYAAVYYWKGERLPQQLLKGWILVKREDKKLELTVQLEANRPQHAWLSHCCWEPALSIQQTKGFLQDEVSDEPSIYPSGRDFT